MSYKDIKAILEDLKKYGITAVKLKEMWENYPRLVQENKDLKRRVNNYEEASYLECLRRKEEEDRKYSDMW